MTSQSATLRAARHIALIFAAAADTDRINGFDIRVLVELCKRLDHEHYEWVQLESVASPLKTSRGTVRNSMTRLHSAGFIKRSTRSGVGGRWKWALPAPPRVIVEELRAVKLHP